MLVSHETVTLDGSKKSLPCGDAIVEGLRGGEFEVQLPSVRAPAEVARELNVARNKLYLDR